jgi:hypothetical protein
MARIVWPNISERVKSRNEIVQRQFEKHHKILTAQTGFEIGERIMYLRREYLDGHLSKWEPSYRGPVLLKRKDANGNFIGVEEDTDLETRPLPPSHMKPYSEPITILEKRKNPIGDSTWNYKVVFDDDETMWIDGDYLTETLIKEYKENVSLAKAKAKGIDKKAEQRRILKERMKRDQELLDKMDEVTEDRLDDIANDDL